MMPSVDDWTGDDWPLDGWLDDVDRGVDTALLITDRQTSITIVRAGTALSAQTVRIETAGRPYYAQTDAGQTAEADAIVIGYKGHPSITDTDIQTGDRFAVDGVGYEVVGVLPGLDNGVQAYAKVRA